MKGEKSKMYIADEKRYETMKFRASGKSGLKLPEVVLDCGIILETPLLLRG